MSRRPAPLASLRPAQAQRAVAVLQAVCAGAAADHAMASELRGKRNIGARDRRWIAEMVYGVLRQAVHYRELHNLDPVAWIAQWLVDHRRADAASLLRLGLPATAPAPPPSSARARRNWPDWLTDAAEALAEHTYCDRLAAALRGEAPVDLRANLLRGSRDQARALLADDGIEARAVDGVPTALRLDSRRPLQATRAWREGWIEPQDAGSQMICALLSARPGQRIADWCAGAGGKALAIAAAQGDRGQIVALDTDARRLERIAPRAQRLGVHSIVSQALPAGRELGLFDAVLVDAPCSGSGTLRRHPELCLRDCMLADMAAEQLAILLTAARHVRPGGRLVYATCSFLPQENDDVVREFLRREREFCALTAEGADAEWMRVDPITHGCDAFCAIALQRTGGATATSAPDGRQ